MTKRSNPGWRKLLKKLRTTGAIPKAQKGPKIAGGRTEK